MIKDEHAGGAIAPSAPWAHNRGVLPEIAEIAGLPARHLESTGPQPARTAVTARVRYIEDKHPDWRRVQEILKLSDGARQWTNFGPVSVALERTLEHLLCLPPDRAVIACASATVGLQALAGLCAVKLGRRLRWVVCAYTFFNQRVGPFADAIVVDCAESGLLDLDAVAGLPDDAWDGLVATNLFAGLQNARHLAAFCRERRKALILDSAGALFGLDRRSVRHPTEAISFHHTKPWGVGEGGCVIVDRTDVPLIRSALNFGVGGPDLLRPFAGNGKISDIACAPILERLERLPTWAPDYQTQRKRIEELCAAASRPLMLPAPSDAILASVPVLAARPVERSDLAHFGFDVGKYYPPLNEFGAKAQRLFAHVVNIPSHAGMAAIGTDTIAAMLRMLSTHAAGDGATDL